jgi:hypothetical protein
VLKILALQSGDPHRVRRALDPSETIAPSLVPHLIPLLAVDAAALDVMRALRTVAAHRPGALIDALLDVRLSSVVRRRVARVMSVCRTRDAVDALLHAFGDDHISVRVQGARTLLLIHRRHPDIPVDAERVMVLIVKEIEAGAPDIGLIFTLLALIYPTAPIRAAYRNLRGGNAHARGFAVEYLHSILPTEIRLKLNPVVERMGGLR